MYNKFRGLVDGKYKEFVSKIKNDNSFVILQEEARPTVFKTVYFAGFASLLYKFYSDNAELYDFLFKETADKRVINIFAYGIICLFCVQLVRIYWSIESLDSPFSEIRQSLLLGKKKYQLVLEQLIRVILVAVISLKIFSLLPELKDREAAMVMNYLYILLIYVLVVLWEGIVFIGHRGEVKYYLIPDILSLLGALLTSSSLPNSLPASIPSPYFKQYSFPTKYLSDYLGEILYKRELLDVEKGNIVLMSAGLVFLAIGIFFTLFVGPKNREMTCKAFYEIFSWFVSIFRSPEFGKKYRCACDRRPAECKEPTCFYQSQI